MIRKYLAIAMAVVVSISIVGCGKSKNDQNKTATEQTQSKNETEKGKRQSFSESGLEYYEPKIWSEKGNVDITCVAPGEFGKDYLLMQIPYGYVPSEFMKQLMEESKNAKSDEDKNKLGEKFNSKLKDFFEIMVIDKNKETNASKEQKQKLFAKYKKQEKVAQKDNLECYVLYNDQYDESGLSEEEKKEFKEVQKSIEELKKNIKLSTPVKAEDKMSKLKNVEFKSKTLEGKEIDSSIFKDSKLTMINIWATYCGPCIQEMPDIEKLYQEVKKENINILGVVSDTPNDENEELAKNIVKKKGVKYDNIIPDEKLKNNVLNLISGVPTTIFVDSKGNIVGNAIVGGRSHEEYKKVIDELLKTLK